MARAAPTFSRQLIAYAVNVFKNFINLVLDRAAGQVLRCRNKDPVSGSRVDREPGEEIRVSMDQWSGYDANRKRVLKFMGDSGVSNPVVLTGDIHTHWVNDLKVDFDDEKSPVVASEFVGTSISSSGDGGPRVVRKVREYLVKLRGFSYARSKWMRADAIEAEGCDECFLVPATHELVEIDRLAEIAVKR